MAIWETGDNLGLREHCCEICGIPISDPPQPINFSHLLERGTYRNYKTDPRNIRIVCGHCHQSWHDNNREDLESGKHGDQESWIIMFMRRDTLRNEANGVSQDA